MPTLLVEDSLNRARRRRKSRKSNGKRGRKCSITKYGRKGHEKFLKACPGKRPIWIIPTPSERRRARRRRSKR